MLQERRLAAILSADVAGYSRLMAEDEQGTIQTLTAYRSLISNLVGDHHGRVVDSPGDNLLAEFPNAPLATGWVTPVSSASTAARSAATTRVRHRLHPQRGDRQARRLHCRYVVELAQRADQRSSSTREGSCPRFTSCRWRTLLA